MCEVQINNNKWKQEETARPVLLRELEKSRSLERSWAFTVFMLS